MGKFRHGVNQLHAVASGQLPNQGSCALKSCCVAWGVAHVASVLQALRQSPQCKDMLTVLTYDENGGY